MLRRSTYGRHHKMVLLCSVSSTKNLGRKEGKEREMREMNARRMYLGTFSSPDIREFFRTVGETFFFSFPWST